MKFYLKASVLKMTFLFFICAKNKTKQKPANPQKQKIKEVPVTVYTCSHSQNWLGKSWILVLLMKTPTWNPRSKETPLRKRQIPTSAT